MGRRPMEDVLENHRKDRLLHLVHWLSITLVTAKDQFKNPPILVESVPRNIPRTRFAVGIWKGYIWTHGQDSRSSEYRKKKHAKGYMWSAERLAKKSSNYQTCACCGQRIICGASTLSFTAPKIPPCCVRRVPVSQPTTPTPRTAYSFFSRCTVS